MPTIKRWLLAVAAVSMLGLTAAACDDDDGAESGTNASQQAVDAVSARVQRNEQMFALVSLSKLELHGMDESLADGMVETSFVPNTRAAVRLLALTDWDTSVDADATAVHEHAVALLKALEAEDLDAASNAAHELHEGAHDLDRAVWAIIAKDLPPDAGGPQPEDEESAETPAADHGAETPEAAATP